MVRALACIGVIVASVACGPSMAVDGNDTSTSGTTTTSAETSSSATAVDVTTAAPESSSTTTTTDATTSSTTTSVDESSSSGEPFECGCPDDTPIGLDDELPDGETAAELLAHFNALSLPMAWIAYGDATTMVHFDAQYRGGALALGPGGEDGCLFLSSPCNEGVQMEVVLVATTDDGWLSLEVPGLLRGYGTGADLETDEVPIADNAGTLAMQPLQQGAEGLHVDSLRVYIERTELRESGFRGVIGASLSGPDCGNRCEVDDDCGPRQACIATICIGGPCDTYEALGDF